MMNHNDSKPMVSVIVPVYNAEKYVERCVRSILKQTYRDLELLLLDDGSRDSSPSILDQIAAEDTRVRVIHKENSGVSDTRNLGISEAKGEYIQFLDADDWITEDATAQFVRAIEESGADMVISDFYRVRGEQVSAKGSIEKDGLISREEFAEKLLERPSDFYFGVLWNKFFRKAIIDRYGIRMDKSISWCEDFIFDMEYIRHCRNIFVLKAPLYYYVKTEGSLVSQGMNVKNTLMMKQTVFRHYSAFFLDIFGEEGYQRRRGEVYRFLLDAARDSMTLPSVFPGSYRLGEERTHVRQEILDAEGSYLSDYRQEKLRDRFLEIVAFRNEMSLEELHLLQYLSEPAVGATTEEVAEILDITQAKLVWSLTRLQADGLIAEIPRGSFFTGIKKSSEQEEENVRTQGKRPLRSYEILQDGENILSELLFVIHDYEEILLEGFTQEERELYQKLEARREENIRKALR